MNQSADGKYGKSVLAEEKTIAAPQVDYLPPVPTTYRPKIGLIGAGGITEHHLLAYQKIGLDVVAICDIDIERAKQRREQFYPNAEVSADFRDVISRDDIEVVDIATHPNERVEIIRAAIESKKHVLSQKPFVVDVALGRELVELADQHNVKLAINQNGRWAPHFAYLAKAVHAGVIGELSSIDFVLHWDHTWTAGTPFEEIHHLLLYDFAIHWFDISIAMLGDIRVNSVYASVARTSYQSVKPPFLAQVVINCGTDASNSVQVRLCFNAHVKYGQEDRTIVAGSKGTMRASGPELNDQEVDVWTADGHARPTLEGCWFDNGFRGTMGELLCAIENDRQPWNNAKQNLRSLELCFAAIKSADENKIVEIAH
ncbi:MAG: Gfo/Idh/MocA family oxidoreductase [Planctomycetales bacterium]|nr:Gfo/Idh/MocA family oxidoreductase [Planctomycetales bacterium]